MSGLQVWSEEFGRHILCALLEHAPAGTIAEPHLRDAIIAAASHPGKLVRGRLVLGTILAHGVDEPIGVALATAVEYFHLASLLLDDLPCMDDAATRRGHPCTHRVHGEATAILAALAFINRGYALAGLALIGQPGEVRLQAQACLDASLGCAGLVGGQARDLRFGDTGRSARDVNTIALAKTGTVFSLGLLLPTLLVRPNREERRALEALCIYWSLAFQGLDDVHDLIATSVDAGKTTGRDRALDRPNLAIAIGIPRARRRLSRLLGQADRQIARLVQARLAWSYLQQFQQYFTDVTVPLIGEPVVPAA
jgi:geranylgeranyl diphosphate synthase, type II